MQEHKPTGYWTGCTCKECKKLQAISDKSRRSDIDRIFASIEKRKIRKTKLDEEVEELNKLVQELREGTLV